MTEKDLLNIVDNFRGKTIAVVGDVMLDHYIFGDSERISPEAPVPVVLVDNEKTFLGGAGNVANNITSLNGKVSIIGVMGQDDDAKQLLQELKLRGIETSGMISVSGRQTTTKLRVVSRGQQIVRIDREQSTYINTKTENQIISFISQNIEDWDGIIISDYAKGVFTRSLAQRVIDLSKHHDKIVIADVRPKRAEFFKGVTFVSPNHIEALEMTGVDDIEKAGKLIQESLGCGVLVTLGAEGMLLFDKNKVEQFPAVAKEVFDVTGAGDTVIAVFTLALSTGASPREAALISNYAAGIVVGKVGTATVSREELLKELKKDVRK